MEWDFNVSNFVSLCFPVRQFQMRMVTVACLVHRSSATDPVIASSVRGM